jgi:hypothetical protein
MDVDELIEHPRDAPRGRAEFGLVHAGILAEIA